MSGEKIGPPLDAEWPSQIQYLLGCKDTRHITTMVNLRAQVSGKTATGFERYLAGSPDMDTKTSGLDPNESWLENLTTHDLEKVIPILAGMLQAEEIDGFDFGIASYQVIEERHPRPIPDTIALFISAPIDKIAVAKEHFKELTIQNRRNALEIDPLELAAAGKRIQAFLASVNETIKLPQEE